MVPMWTMPPRSARCRRAASASPCGPRSRNCRGFSRGFPQTGTTWRVGKTRVSPWGWTVGRKIFRTRRWKLYLTSFLLESSMGPWVFCLGGFHFETDPYENSFRGAKRSLQNLPTHWLSCYLIIWFIWLIWMSSNDQTVIHQNVGK